MRTLGKGVKTRGSRVVGKGLFDVLSGNQTLDFGKLMDKGSADLRRLQKGKGLFDLDYSYPDERRKEAEADLMRLQRGEGFDDVINHYKKVQAEKEAEKAKEYAERKSRIENAERDFRALVARSGDGYVGGNGIFGDLVEDALIEGGKKLYKFDKEHGSHLKEGVKSGFKNMVSNFFTGGRGIESATRFGRGHMRFAVMPDVMEGNGFLDNLPKYKYDPNDVSGWVEKERCDAMGECGGRNRRGNAFADILGEGM